MCLGLGAPACCFLGHADLLEYARSEAKTAGEGGAERAEGASGDQPRSVGPAGPHEPSQQPGIYCTSYSQALF